MGTKYQLVSKKAINQNGSVSVMAQSVVISSSVHGFQDNFQSSVNNLVNENMKQIIHEDLASNLSCYQVGNQDEEMKKNEISLGSVCSLIFFFFFKL